MRDAGMPIEQHALSGSTPSPPIGNDLADALAAEPEEKVRERLASLSHQEAKP
jgi:hypothetical protein